MKFDTVSGDLPKTSPVKSRRGGPTRAPRRDNKVALLPEGIEELKECVFDCEGRGTDFKRNCEALATYVARSMRNGGDMHFCITTQTMFTPPEPTRPTIYADQIQQLDYRIERAEYVKQLNLIRSQLRSIYSTIWSQCTERMRARVVGQANYGVMHAQQDSLQLLNTLRTLTHNFDSRRYNYMSLFIADRRLRNFFQGANMDTATYFHRIKHLVAIIDQVGGTIGQHPCLVSKEMELLTGYSIDIRAAHDQVTLALAQAKARDKYLACLFLSNACKERYGNAIDDLHNDYLKGHRNTYPESLNEAYAFLDDVRMPKAQKVAPAASFAQEFQGVDEDKGVWTFVQNGKKVVRCFGCGKKNTYLNSCKNTDCVKKWRAKQNDAITAIGGPTRTNKKRTIQTQLYLQQC